MAGSRLAHDLRNGVATLPVRDTPSARKLRRDLSGQIRTAQPKLVLAAAEEISRDRDDLSRFVAYELIANHAQARQLLSAARLRRLGSSLDSWGSVDCFACYLAGPAWRENQISTSEVHRWARSSNRWWRRAALVSTVPLNNRTRGGTGDSLRTLGVCRLLLQDQDDMVVKALSWALRELAKRDPASVEAFLVRHQKTLAPRVRREVANKLRTGLKNPRRPSRSTRKHSNAPARF